MTVPDEVDYAVVGAGSAGSVVAARVAERSGATVALLEAGGEDRSPWIRVPLGFGRLVRDAGVLWPYATEPEPHLHGRSIPWPRGRVLGGSGAVNGLVYLRGAPSDFDGWAAAGAAGWSYADCLPYFVRSEAMLAPTEEAHLHGTDGPMPVSVPRRPSEVARRFIRAALDAGHPPNGDFNGSRLHGVGLAPMNIRRGQRVSTADAYLKPALRRRAPIALSLDTLATRILLEGRRAVGLAYRAGDGAERVLRVRREIVLAAGAINTPQLLMLSGIGPAEHLRTLGIDVVADLPVGEGLQDHVLARIAYAARNVRTLNGIMASPLRKALIGIEYALARTGPLAVAATEACLFADVGVGGACDPAPGGPDVQIQCANFLIEDYRRGLSEIAGFVTSVSICRPRSSGRVSLRTSDARDPPSVQANYFSAPEDLQTMLAGLRLCADLALQSSLDAIIVARRAPAEVGDPGKLEDHIRSTASTVFHPCATCRMGENPRAVVDQHLSVAGCENLRIADASIFPTIPSTNIHAATVMVAERAADLILAAT